VVSFTARQHYPKGKSPWYPLDRRLGGPQSRSGRGGEEKNSQPLPGLKHPIIQPVAQRYITDISLLSYATLITDKAVTLSLTTDVPLIGRKVTDKLTPWKRVLLEKLIVTQLAKNFLPFMEFEGPITVLTTTRHWSLPSSKRKWCTPSHHIRPIVIVSSPSTPKSF
jgi:hypothetical protein